MQRRYFWWTAVALIIIVFSGFLTVLPATQAIAHASSAPILLDAPTSTPDASTILQMAQQEEVNIQTILNIISIMLVVFPLLLSVAAVVLGVIGFRGFNDLQKRGEATLTKVEEIKGKAEGYSTAIEHTQKAIAYMGLGDRLSNQKDIRQAVEAYKEAARLLPQDPQINYVIGRIYSGLGYYDEAIQVFGAALKAKPDYPEAHMELGLAYRRLGEYQTSPDAQVLREQDYDKAVVELQKAIDLRPNYDDALSTLGGLYRRRGNQAKAQGDEAKAQDYYTKALNYYTRAFQANMQSSYALTNMASLSWYLGKLAEARIHYAFAETVANSRINTTHAEVYWDYYDLALSQLVLGRTDEAKANYQKAIADTPGVVQFDSVLNVLYFLRDAKAPQEKIVDLEDVIKMIEKEKATKIVLV